MRFLHFKTHFQDVKALRSHFSPCVYFHLLQIDHDEESTRSSDECSGSERKKGKEPGFP